MALETKAIADLKWEFNAWRRAWQNPHARPARAPRTSASRRGRGADWSGVTRLVYNPLQRLASLLHGMVASLASIGRAARRRLGGREASP